MSKVEKTWKGYFLEFLMLFLAVSLGFLADNYGEKLSERTKEKEYIASMIKDVKEDRVNINEIISVNTQRSLKLDSLARLSFKKKLSKKDIIKLQELLIHLLRHPEFINPTELTMQQLKNAGGMRLIKSKKAINDIIRYDSKAKKIANQQIYYENYQNKAISISTKIFNIQNVIQQLKNGSGINNTNNFGLINNNSLQLKQFGNAITMYKGIMDYYVALLKEMNIQGEFLITTLNKEYKL